VIIGTAGHIDHGKTSLVKAITGVDADRLKEEKARGITIDLGFAYWPQEDGSSIGFVDVPGHEGYVHNMLAGVTGVSALMLVIAANEGIKPQTREHLLIAELLGIRIGVVALTKVDIADAAMREQRKCDIQEILAGMGQCDVPVIAVSTVTGEGLAELKGALRELRQQDSDSSVLRPFRLAVDRVFSVQGAGTVVTGGILAGRVSMNDRLIISPSGREVRVRGLHAQNRRTEHAGVGERAAINLAGVGVKEIKRGDVLMEATLHQPTLRFDAMVRLADGDSKPLATWAPIHIHAGTGAWTARIVPLEQGRIEPGTAQLAQIVLDRPVALLVGDRFVIRDASARRTIGGGTVLDIHAPERNRRRPERLAALTAIAQKGSVEALADLLALPPHAIDIDACSASAGLHPEAFDAVIARENLIVLNGDTRRFIFTPPLVLTLSRRIQERLSAHHTQHPDQAGLSIDRLRLSLPERLASDSFAAIVAHLMRRSEFAASGAWLRLPYHVPRLSSEHEALWVQIQPLLSGEDRFKPPRINELAEHLKRREDTIRGLMKRLARRGDVDEVAEDHFLLRPAVAELLAVAQETEAAEPDRWFNAAGFRDRIGIGRRMAILILEFFDRQGVTIRKGDLRRVDPRKAEAFEPHPTRA
jgi:selenocysteine-specific elongation factor